MDNFVHLHLHTQYSLLDGANKISEVIKRAVELGQPAIAITDHGNMHGAIEFYDEAKKAGIKPIIGCELYVAPNSRFDRTTGNSDGHGYNHLTVMARSAEGYKNLCNLVTLAYKEGFYYKPRVDHEILKKYSEGLIVLSGCLASELADCALKDREKQARELIEMYASIFKDNYYLEIQPHAIPEQRKLNEYCVHFAKSVGIPIVATTDCHYPSADYHLAQEVLMCISTGKLLTDPTRIKHDGVTLFLKDSKEMLAEFGGASYASEAISNSVEIANKVDLSFDFSKYYLPKLSDSTEDEIVSLMKKQSREGLESRFENFRKLRDDFDVKLQKEYEQRLEEEMNMIVSMGFASYFLVVADFINWAKNNDIPVGPGRGSGAGSLVAYALRITEVDPIQHKLLFERFLNPERVSLPDIDVDFCITGRDAVIKYVVEKYGADRVAQICTFGTLKAKQVLKDVGRVLGLSFAETDKIAQLVPAPRQGFDYPLAEAMKMEKRLAEYAKGPGKELIELALKLEGLTRHSSTHAAGVVIGDRPLVDLIPLMVDKDGADVTQYSMKYVEKVGLLKFDFLGLKTLTVLKSACDIIKQSQGENIDLNSLPLDDTKTYSLLCSGNTTGVFQLESTGIAEVTMRLKPSCFDDLVAILALYRPGPLDAGMVDHYIERKHGREEITYLHPLMADILQDTYGIIVYQEQIMQLARTLAGYSLGDADLLRRAMGKKNPQEMAKQRSLFIEGAAKQKINQKLAAEIFDQMETFARYGFNRSHSAAYAMISYQTAYLKAHYPVEFMAALMSLEMNDSDKTLKNMNECRNQSIKVLPPDINISQSSFTVSGQEIRFGLSALSGVGEKAVDVIIEARLDGDFKDLEDIAERVDCRSVNKRVYESLIKSGACDSFKLTRAELFSRIEEVIKFAQSLQKSEDTNQISLFGQESSARTIPRRNSNASEWPVNLKLSMEREALGFYLSGHPLDKFTNALSKMGVVATAQAKAGSSKEGVKIGGVVTALKLKNTKKGDRYASFNFEDATGSIDTLIWPSQYEKYAHYLQQDDPIVATGRTEVTEERSVFIIDSIEPLLGLRDRQATQGVLQFGVEDALEDRLEILQSVLNEHSGNCPVRVSVRVEGEEISVLLRDKNDSPVCVKPSEELCEKVEKLFGRPVLSFI